MFQSIAFTYAQGNNTGILKVDSASDTGSDDDVSVTLEPETEWILNNLRVVDPTALLNATFGETVVEAVEASANLIDNVFEGQETNWGHESEMCEPFTQAFNKWIAGVVPICKEDDYSPTDSFECLNTSTNSYIGPGLYLTFDSKRIQASEAIPCDTPNVFIKLDINTDLLIGNRGNGSDTAKECKVLVQQLFHYVAYNQWSSLPYRFSWTISISNDTLRVWRWSSSGVIVTEPIYYLQKPTPIIQFVQLLATGPYSRLGLDVGVGMTFSSVATPEIAKKLKSAIDKYSEAGGRSIALIRWVEKANKAKVLVFDIQFPTLSHRALKYFVAERGVTWRFMSDANSDEGIDPKDIHVLKMSWHNIPSISESAIFQMVKNRSNNGTVPHLATVLAAGEIISTEQRLGLFQAHSSGPAMPSDKELAKNYSPLALDQSADESQIGSSHPRILRWILFKETGIRLNSFRTVKEMLQAFWDAVSAHQSLCDIGILHQDISEENILMDLSNARRGLLSDLEMADDLQVPEGQEPPGSSAMNGTPRFHSLALQFRPIHRSWHDLESFFWFLVYMAFKYVPNTTFEEFGRTQGLKSVFPDGAHTSSVIADAKRKFLYQGVIKTVGNDALQFLLENFRLTFEDLHVALQRARGCWKMWTALAKIVELPNQSRLLLMPYSVESWAHLSQYIDDSNAALEELRKRPYAPDLAVTGYYKLPEYVLATIKDALLDDSELDPNSPSFDY